MNRHQKIAFAAHYAADLVANHAGISGVVLGGSVARGNDLPISDVDLWCFVDDATYPLPIQKHWSRDLYIDIEQRPASELTQVDVANDSYFCGYMHDALVLYDRCGDIENCRRRARRCFFSPQHQARHLASIREGVDRNRGNLEASAETQDAPEACRAGIFATWSLCDYMLVARGISPGGASGIGRLLVAWPQAANALVEFEGVSHLASPKIEHLVQTYRSVADSSAFYQMWFSKIEWMLANSYKPNALHTLWIALGLRIRGAPDDLRDQIGVASSRWLHTIGWDWDTVLAKSGELQALIERFCMPSVDNATNTAVGGDA